MKKFFKLTTLLGLTGIATLTLVACGNNVVKGHGVKVKEIQTPIVNVKQWNSTTEQDKITMKPTWIDDEKLFELKYSIDNGQTYIDITKGKEITGLTRGTTILFKWNIKNKIKNYKIKDNKNLIIKKIAKTSVTAPTDFAMHNIAGTQTQGPIAGTQVQKSSQSMANYFHLRATWTEKTGIHLEYKSDNKNSKFIRLENNSLARGIGIVNGLIWFRKTSHIKFRWVLEPNYIWENGQKPEIFERIL